MSSDTKAYCKQSNIVYSIECNTCKQRESRAIYWGKSARNGHLRGSEHYRALQRKDKQSIMYKHIVDKHGEKKEDVDFNMKIVKTFKDCLNRQIFEGRMIRNEAEGSLLNSKSELYGPSIKRKVFDV